MSPHKRVYHFTVHHRWGHAQLHKHARYGHGQQHYHRHHRSWSKAADLTTRPHRNHRWHHHLGRGRDNVSKLRDNHSAPTHHGELDVAMLRKTFEYLNRYAPDSDCGARNRQAWAAAGVALPSANQSKDLGKYLLASGKFELVRGGSERIADIRVWGPVKGHPDGHVDTVLGNAQHGSSGVQKYDSPYEGGRYAVYRFKGTFKHTAEHYAALVKNPHEKIQHASRNQRATALGYAEKPAQRHLGGDGLRMIGSVTHAPRGGGGRWSHLGR